VEAILRWERPTTVTEIIVFLDWQGIIEGLSKGFQQ
jgi:hypothetical protein